MVKATNQLAIPDEIITSKIYLVRDKKVMLDEDLAVHCRPAGIQ